MKSSAMAFAALACAAMIVPSAASAQSYGNAYQSPYSAHYDPCLRDQRQRQASAGMLGAAIGAVAGSQIASRNARTEGTLLGGLLGAAVGANVGRGTAACTPAMQSYPAQPVPYPEPAPRRYDEHPDYGRGYDDSYDYYDDYPASYTTGQRPADDGCRLAESEVRMPDGRVEIRHVRTCPDSSGRYRIVD